MPPTPQELEQIMERKNKMRRQAYDARAAQENKDEVSAAILRTIHRVARIPGAPEPRCGI